MKTQEELRAEFQRLMDADMLDEAEAVLDQLEPLSEEEFRKMLAEAPMDDEPLTPGQRARLDEVKSFIRSLSIQQAG